MSRLRSRDGGGVIEEKDLKEAGTGGGNGAGGEWAWKVARKGIRLGR
jgi:hypothetical protein